MDASRISLIGPVEPGFQSGFEAISLIISTSSEILADQIIPESSDESSYSKYVELAHPRQSFERQQPDTPPSNASSLGKPSHSTSFPIYRFSDRRTPVANSANSHISKHVIVDDLRLLARSSPGRNDYEPCQITKVWSPNQRVILLNANDERVDADLGPIDPEAQRRLSKQAYRQKLCNNFVILGDCSRNGCPYLHDATLDQEEMKALVYHARLLPCIRGSECRLEGCWYGHTCPIKCDGGPRCMEKVHHVDRSAVKIYNAQWW